MPDLLDDIGCTNMLPTNRCERMRSKRMDITTIVNFLFQSGIGLKNLTSWKAAFTGYLLNSPKYPNSIAAL